LAADPEQDDKIVPVPVMPLVSPEKAAEQWRLFEALKAKLLGVEDYQDIAGKRYIKRSGFRKIAVYFGISDRILKEERTERPDGSFFWKIEVEAYAPNGRACVGVGACDSLERRFAHAEHDVYATAHTRAKSRAISDLVAGGAVSAEEVLSSSESESASSETAPSTNEPQPKVPVTKEVMDMPRLRQFPLTEGLKSVGMLNALNNEEVSLVPEKPIKIESPTISGFLIPKILEPMCSKHQFSYIVAKTADGSQLLYIVVTGKFTDDQVKELQAPTRWAFAKALENEQTKT
jgi:hypothetical protein